MSGAAAIAAAKNRRSKTELVPKNPVITCKTVNGPSAQGKGQVQSKAALKEQPLADQLPSNLVDKESLRIMGPMPPNQILMIHEQRLNRFDERFGIQGSDATAPTNDEEFCDKVSELELKIHMLEEVIMNLQLTITNVQSFAMETSLAMLKLQNTQSPVATPGELSRPTTPDLTLPAPTLTVPAPTLTLPAPTLTVEETVVDVAIHS